MDAVTAKVHAEPLTRVEAFTIDGPVSAQPFEKPPDTDTKPNTQISTTNKPQTSKSEIAATLAPSTPSNTHPSSDSHQYGPSNIHGSATVHMGNAHVAMSPASELHGPSVVSGNMNVSINNSFYGQGLDLMRFGGHTDPAIALRGALYDETLNNRRAQLARVETSSFDWIWTETSFPSWLESSEGVFWICGKPTSGKSTLINHLGSHPKGSNVVKNHLTKHGNPWTLASFFFDFRAGADIANTPLGMLRRTKDRDFKWFARRGR